MSFVKYAAAAAAFAGSAIAQCSTDSTTIRNAADATGLASCSTFTGAVVIPTDAAGQLNFGSLGAIRGDFIGSSPNVTAISADSIQSMGRFQLRDMQQLYTLSMQQLRTIDSIDWTGLATLQRPNFGTGVQTVNSAINVQNTGIQDLSSLNIRQIMGPCQISNNLQLTGLAWDTTNMTNFIVSGNGPQQLNLSLPSLQSVGTDFDVSNCSDVSIGALGTVGGLLSVQSSSIQSLMLPNLTRVSTISVANNDNLQNVSLPNLNMTDSSLRLVNNDKLGGDLAFPALVNLRGSLNITGAFSSVSIPKLNQISGTCYLWSTEDIDSTCQQVSKWQSSGKIQGKLDPKTSSQVNNGIVCHSMSRTASEGGGSSGSGTRTGSSSSSSSSSNAASSNYFSATPASLFGATGLVAAMLGMI